MSIFVCDALCGSGKTSACINYMNEHTEQHFIFVTQFLSETERIIKACKSRKFIAPESAEDRSCTKLADLASLLEQERNIATTHALFANSTADIKKLVREKHYVLVLDETVDIMRVSDFKPCDVNMLERANVLRDVDGIVNWIDDEYNKDNVDGDGLFSSAIRLSKSKNLLNHNNQFYYWSIPPDLFDCFDAVFVLTYMFHAQLLKGFFEMNKLHYSYIGVKKFQEGYAFCPPEQMDRSRELRDKIHILEHPKLNSVGDGRYDLSHSSYVDTIKKQSDFCERLRKNLVNLFRNVYKAPSSQVMWTTFKEFRGSLSAKGYANGFVSYNKRASNEYADRRYLAYCVNNFLRPWEERYYREHGVKLENDSYGLSILVQWIFRSAIRNGQEVWLYLPSARMRSLLYQWLDNLACGKDLEPLSYRQTPVMIPKKISRKGE